MKTTSWPQKIQYQKCTILKELVYILSGQVENFTNVEDVKFLFCYLPDVHFAGQSIKVYKIPIMHDFERTTGPFEL